MPERPLADHEAIARAVELLAVDAVLGVQAIVLPYGSKRGRGLNRLVVALKRQRERGGEVVLRSPVASTRRVLDMVGLTQVFTVVA